LHPDAEQHHVHAYSHTQHVSMTDKWSHEMTTITRLPNQQIYEFTFHTTVYGDAIFIKPGYITPSKLLQKILMQY
jgi:hypothetical protein